MDIEGMHARNCAKVSTLCKKSIVRVSISSGGKTADGRDIMELMALGALYRDELTLEEIAASASVSKSAALQTFQSGIRVSPVSYLIQYRLSRAAELLYTTEKPVSTIAEETGFTSAGYFCRKFKERYQMSPIEYRRNKV